MKAALIALSLVLIHQVNAAETKQEISLDNVVSEINSEKSQKNKEFIALVEAKKEDSVVKTLKADKEYAFVNLNVKNDHILTYCIKNKMWKAAEELIKGGSNLNHKDSNGKVALMYATEAKNRYLVTLLIATKADKKIKDNTGMSAEEYLKKNGLE